MSWVERMNNQTNEIETITYEKLKDLYDRATSRLKEFEDDRYCPNGCVEYQLDKIEIYKDYFGEINESAVLMKSIMELNPVLKDSQMYKELEKIQLICATAVDGSKWI